MTLGESSISVVLTPSTPHDLERLQHAVDVLVAEDADCYALAAPDGAQTVLSAPSIQHLERLLDRLKREFRVEAGVGRPTSTEDTTGSL